MIDEVNQSLNITIALITASAGIIGVMFGSVISALVSWKMKTKELQLKFVEQIFQKRIHAYEKLLGFIQLLRGTISTGHVDEKGYAVTTMVIYAHKNQHDKFQMELFDLMNNYCHFLNYRIYEELYYLQVLEVNMNNMFIDSNMNKWEEMSLLIKNDYIEIANILNELALLFFEKEIYNIKIKTNRGNYEETKKLIKKRLDNSSFKKNYQRLKEYTKIS